MAIAMVVVFSATASVMVFIASVTVVVASAMILTVIRHVVISIPALLHKIHWSVTGVIAPTVAAPLPCMARWHAQVDWLIFIIVAVDNDGSAIDDTGLRVRIFTNIDATIKAGLANADGYANIGG